MNESIPSMLQPPHAAQKLRTWLRVSGGLDLTFSASTEVVKPFPIQLQRCDREFFQHWPASARRREYIVSHDRIVRHPRKDSPTRERSGPRPMNPPQLSKPVGDRARHCNTTCVS